MKKDIMLGHQILEYNRHLQQFCQRTDTFVREIEKAAQPYLDEWGIDIVAKERGWGTIFPAPDGRRDVEWSTNFLLTILPDVHAALSLLDDTERLHWMNRKFSSSYEGPYVWMVAKSARKYSLEGEPQAGTCNYGPVSPALGRVILESDMPWLPTELPYYTYEVKRFLWAKKEILLKKGGR